MQTDNLNWHFTEQETVMYYHASWECFGLSVLDLQGDFLKLSKIMSLHLKWCPVWVTARLHHCTFKPQNMLQVSKKCLLTKRDANLMTEQVSFPN